MYQLRIIGEQINDISIQQGELFSNDGIDLLNVFLFLFSVLQYLIDEFELDPNSFAGNMTFDVELKKAYYNDVYIDLGDYLAIYLSNGHINQCETENPSNFKADTEDGKFICFTTITVKQRVDMSSFILNLFVV